MLFTIGNLITLGVVVLALILYRVFDRNNRSLDKVRKYADKCKEDIAAYAEEKSAAVKDFGIALKVEQKAAAELMNRIHTLTEEELAKKVQTLSQIDGRIREYDTSLEDLINMTARVQENLNRIREESVFVENTGKRIGEAREKLEHIEKEIVNTGKSLDTLELRFERENAEALEKAVEAALAAARSTVSDLETSAEVVERKVEDHREAVDKIERERHAKLTHDVEMVNKILKEALEKAAGRAGKLEDAALVKLREQAQERVNQIKTMLEEKIKTVQESAKTKLTEIQDQLKTNREEWKTETAGIESRQKTFRAEWKKDTQELAALAKQQQQEIKTAAAQEQQEITAAVKRQREEWNRNIEEFSAQAKRQYAELAEAIKGQSETLNSELARQRGEWEKEVKDLSALAKKQREDWEKHSRGAGDAIIAGFDARLDEYRKAQEEQFRQLSAITSDAERLEEELRRSMQEAVGRVNGDFARFENESRKTRENAAAAFNTQAQSLRMELDGLGQELNVLKEKAFDNVSEKLKVFEDDFCAGLGRRSAEIDRQLSKWYDNIDTRLAAIAEEGTAERQKAEERITGELRQNLSAQGEKLVSDLDRLKTETAAFEEGIREEMRGADESRRSFNEQLERDLEEARKTAENELKTQIGQYHISLSETLRQSQREIEEQIRETAVRSEERIAGLESTAEESRRAIEEWQNQYSARIKALDASMEEARRRSRELVTENDERIAAARSALDDIRRELSAQAKLFDKTDERKIELDRYIEDINASLDRLDQRKNEIVQIESQFTQIKRLQDDANAKMTRFLSEKRRLEVMEKDFIRLQQTSQEVEVKLVQVSTSDDILQGIQVQIRRLDDAIRETEEKYQRIERKSQTLEETNNGIDRNFKSLQEAESVLKKTSEEIVLLGREAESLRLSIETLSSENEKARDAAEKIATLDESLVLIEKRIAEMNAAREWLARTETEFKKLDDDIKQTLRLTRSLLDREGGIAEAKGKSGGKGAPPPRDRDNIIKLRRQGWTVEQIAKAMHISQGEVELILELGPKES